MLGKTEGNSCVNNFTRGFATMVFRGYIAKKTGRGHEIRQTVWKMR